MPLERRFGQKLEIFAADPEACAAIRGRLARARAMEARLAREAGRAPAEIAREALAALAEDDVWLEAVAGNGGGR